jgi:thioredoxin-like negative regulator of GroEL
MFSNLQISDIEGVNNLNNNINNNLNEKILMLFYADWCGHCQQMKPAWNELVSKCKNKINIASVNSDMAPNVAGGHGNNIMGFPTLIIISKGNEKKYEGDRSLESMMKFVNTNSNNSITKRRDNKNKNIESIIKSIRSSTQRRSTQRRPSTQRRSTRRKPSTKRRSTRRKPSTQRKSSSKRRPSTKNKPSKRSQSKQN